MNVEGPDILVLDAGSSGLKASLFDAAGTVIAAADAGYPEATPTRLAPEAWWRAAIAATRALGPVAPGAIVLTGAMENLIPVGADRMGLGEAILYPDPCGAAALADSAAALAALDAERICGNAPEPLMSAFKLMWLRQHELERFAAARWFLPGAKDFLALRLTGIAVTDPTGAATTGLMDIAARDWSAPLCALAGVELHRLPTIRPATAIIGPLSASAAEALGLPAGVPVVNGCGDGGATTLGGGATEPADVSLYLGSSGWVARIAGPEGLAEPRSFYRLPHPLNDGVIEIAPILAAGAAANWARSALGLDTEAAEGLAASADSAPGDVLFLPYLNGERSPFLDLEVRGAFLGLGADTGRAALYHAALEGVALAIAANLDAMGGAGGRVSLVGGGANSPVWRQLIADSIGRPILVAADPVAAPGFGAFCIARAALGLAAPAGSFAIGAAPRPERAERVRRQRERFATATALVRQFA